MHAPTLINTDIYIYSLTNVLFNHWFSLLYVSIYECACMHVSLCFVHTHTYIYISLLMYYSTTDFTFSMSVFMSVHACMFHYALCCILTNVLFNNRFSLLYVSIYAFHTINSLIKIVKALWLWVSENEQKCSIN